MTLRIVVQRFSRCGATKARRLLGAKAGRWVLRAGMATSATFPPTSPFAPHPSNLELGIAPARWLEKYRQHDPADLWQVGVFPVQDAMRPMESSDMEQPEQEGEGEDKAPAESILTSHDVWDTQGMLSPLAEGTALSQGVGLSVNEMLRALEQAVEAEAQAEAEAEQETEEEPEDEVRADSTLRKRRKKMNKHKYRKRKKALRMRTKRS